MVFHLGQCPGRVPQPGHTGRNEPEAARKEWRAGGSPGGLPARRSTRGSQEFHGEFVAGRLKRVVEAEVIRGKFRSIDDRDLLFRMFGLHAPGQAGPPPEPKLGLTVLVEYQRGRAGDRAPAM